MDEKPSIAVDLDGTILKDAEFPGFGEPEPGVREALAAFRSLGYKVRVYTCRVNWLAAEKRILPRTYNDIADYLAKHEIPYDDIVMLEEGKPFASFYVGNNAVRYEGNWDKVVQFIVNQDMKEMQGRVAKMIKAMGRAGVVEKITRGAVKNVSK